MNLEARGERRLERELGRATRPRRAAIIIAIVTTTITIAAGLLMTLADRKDFPTIGGGLWWAVQTVTTVGYGDHVPETVTGQLMGALVMLLGIGFVTVITASITSSFVHRQRQQQTAASDAANTEHLQAIDARLHRIEAALNVREG